MDMLVRLYAIEYAPIPSFIRKPIGAERESVINWVKSNYSSAWASEAETAITRNSCFIAMKEGLIGFSCYDATCLGFFGPMGTKIERQGIGKALLSACLMDMKLKGYAYAIIGAVGPEEFYRKTVGATPIDGSTPGIYIGMIA